MTRILHNKLVNHSHENIKQNLNNFMPETDRSKHLKH